MDIVALRMAVVALLMDVMAPMDKALLMNITTLLMDVLASFGLVFSLFRGISVRGG